MDFFINKWYLNMTALKKKSKDNIIDLEKLQEKYDSLKKMSELEIAKNKKKEQELKTKEERYSGLLNNLDAGIVIHSSDTSIIDSNWKASELLGLSEDQMKGKTAIDPNWTFLQSDDSPLPFEKYPVIQIKNSKKPIQNFFVGINRPKSHDVVWVLVNGFPVLNENEDIIEIVISFIDITDRENAWKILRKEKDLIKTILNQVTDPIFVKDNQHRITHANTAFYNLFGLNEIKVLGKTLAENVPENERHNFMAVDRLVLDTGIPNQQEETLTLDGFTRTIVTKKSRFTDESDKKFLVGSIHDITDLKKSESELIAAKERAEKSEVQIQSYVENSPIGIYITDEKGDCTYSNCKWLEITGLTVDESLGKGWMKSIHPDDKTRIETEWCKSINSISEFVYEIRFITPKGKTSIIEGSAKPLYNDEKKHIGYLGSNIDITEKKQSEKAIIESQRLNAIGEMAASVAHDFNNSLQAMMGNIIIAKLEEKLPTSTIQNLNNIATIISDVADRVKSLQRFGDTKRANENYKLINLNEIIEETIMQLNPLWKDKLEKDGLKISFKLDKGEIPQISGNEGELKSTFYNILKNSIEAMPHGGNINIVTESKNQTIDVIIQDTGIGMSDETQLKIFQPFYTTKGFDVGRGLGMSGVYSIIKGIGGEIFVKSSEVGIGTTIELKIPINAQSNSFKIIDKEPKSTTSPKVLNVLWVDDDALIRISSAKMVEQLGHNCDKASNGLSALELLEKKSYDLVITDIGMPEMNGWQLADKINQNFGKRIKIAIVSGWDIEEKEKIEHQIDYILDKPFKLEKLVKLLSDV